MKKFTFLLAAMLLTLATNVHALDTYEQLQSIADIDESAQYVLGIDGTGFHYSGTSAWGLVALPTVQTPIYYTLTKAEDGSSFTAKATIDGEEYYLQLSSGKFSMIATSSTNPANINITIGTTKVEDDNYAVANSTNTDVHIRHNPQYGLRAYDATTGNMAYFYKVIASSATLSSVVISGTPNTTTYYEGEAFEPAGLIATAIYSDGEEVDVTAGVTWSITPSILEVGTTSVSVVASFSDVQSTAFAIDNITVQASDTFVKVTSSAQLVDGQSIIITDADGTVCLGNTQASNNRPAGNILAGEDGSIKPTHNTEIITLNKIDGETVKWELQVEGGYLYAASSNSNYLKTQTENTANGEWTIEIGEGGIAQIKATGTNTRNQLQYLRSSQLFSCYSSTQQDVAIYAVKSSITTANTNVVLDNNVVKTIENGQLVIVRDGVKYNAQGVKLN